MREIKFRAWHKDEKAMLFAGDAYGTRNGIDCCVYELQGQPVELMQYTGLKDKNGVEIYEGDICKISGCGNFLQAIIDPLHGLCFGDYTVTYHDCIMEGDEIEVVGNIYQNPELLNS